MEDDDEIDAMTLTPQIPFKPKTMITINVKMLHDRTYPLSVDDEVAFAAITLHCPPFNTLAARLAARFLGRQIVVADLKA